MPFVKYEDGLFTRNESLKNLYLPMASSLMLCFLVVMINLASFPGKQTGHSWIENSGWIVDVIQWLILNFILWSFNRLKIDARLRRGINLGLHIWIISAAFDVMDEFIQQPRWVGYYIEDAFKLAGMLFVSIGVYFIVRYVNGKYADVSIDSYRDELTRLPNRRYFRNILLELKNTDNYIFIIDIDSFKNINDKYGHDMGDEVLRAFGNLLSSLHDGNVTAFRIGGEEFAVIMTLPSQQDASVLAEKILSRTRDVMIRNKIRFTVSIGVGQKKEDETVGNLLKRVDIALYEAKKQGKNRIEWAAE